MFKHHWSVYLFEYWLGGCILYGTIAGIRHYLKEVKGYGQKKRTPQCNKTASVPRPGSITPSGTNNENRNHTQ